VVLLAELDPGHLDKVVILPILSLTWIENAGEFRRTGWSVPPEVEPMPVLAAEMPGPPGEIRLVREFSAVNQIPDELRNVPAPSGLHQARRGWSSPPERRAVALRLALAGDTMLGRGVADVLRADPRAPLVAPEVAEAAASADLFVLNLECCISERGERFADPRKPFFFRAPPIAAQRLAELGVDAVTLANNHALDYGPVALLDTLGTSTAPASRTSAPASTRTRRAPRRWSAACASWRPAITPRPTPRRRIAPASHMPTCGAAGYRSGCWRRRGPTRTPSGCSSRRTGDRTCAPSRSPRCARRRRPGGRGRHARGRPLAHVFQGVAGRVLYDLGDFIDDYAVDRRLRNDLGCCGSSPSTPTARPCSRRSPSPSSTATRGWPPATTRRGWRAACASCARPSGRRCARKAGGSW